MKKLVFFISVAFLGFAANAQDNKPVLNTSENPNAPEITFTETVHDYGNIAYDADSKIEFKFKNTGKEPLLLENVRASCGCTIPVWPKEPILPGQTKSIQVTYDTKRVGAFQKDITVVSNAKTSTVILKIKGNVGPKPAESTPEKPTNGAIPQAH